MTTTAYPLSWPIGWKRTEPRQRVRARFNRKESNYRDTGNGGGYRYQTTRELTVNNAIDRILDELRALGVSRENIIISTNLDVRLDGLPRSGQRAPQDPGAAVYWTRNKEQRCMAIDQYDSVAGNLAAIAATLNAMRAIERHGGVEILSRAFAGFAQLPAPSNDSMGWWDVLQVARNASNDEIRAAFRALAREYHPDNLSTGDAEKMLILNKAYELAQNERGL